MSDELKAEDENQLLNDNKFVELSAFDDDAVHLEKHKDAASTPATMAHVEAHKKMMMHKRENPQAFPQPAAAQPGMDLNPVSAPQAEPQKSTAPMGQSLA